MAPSRSSPDHRFPHGLMFHRFRPAGAEPDPQGALTLEQFERVLRFVGLDRILPPSEWLARLHRGALRDDDVCITFDDGLRSQIDYALPVLEKHGLQAFWFVYSCVFNGQPVWSEVYSHASGRIGGMTAIAAAFLERCPAHIAAALRTPEFARYAEDRRRSAPFYSQTDLEYRFIRNRVDAPVFEGIMNTILLERGIDPDDVAGTLWLDEADLRRLTASGHCVGLHSWDHPYEMARLEPAAQRAQYRRNRAHLIQATGVAPVSMAHPLDSYNEDTLAILREMGVTCGFRANVALPPSGRINGDPLELAREDAAALVAAMGDAP